MPCSSEGYGPPSTSIALNDLQELKASKAMLCGLATALTKANTLENWLNQVDWVEAGVSRSSFELWWSEHQEEDRRRRLQEAAARNRLQLIASAKAKLSDAEKEALGIR